MTATSPRGQLSWGDNKQTKLHISVPLSTGLTWIMMVGGFTTQRSSNVDRASMEFCCHEHYLDILGNIKALTDLCMVNPPDQWFLHIEVSNVMFWYVDFPYRGGQYSRYNYDRIPHLYTSWPLGDVVISKVQSLNVCYGLSSGAHLVKLLSDECHRTPLMTSQYWIK